MHIVMLKTCGKFREGQTYDFRAEVANAWIMQGVAEYPHMQYSDEYKDYSGTPAPVAKAVEPESVENKAVIPSNIENKAVTAGEKPKRQRRSRAKKKVAETTASEEEID